MVVGGGQEELLVSAATSTGLEVWSSGKAGAMAKVDVGTRAGNSGDGNPPVVPMQFSEEEIEFVTDVAENFGKLVIDMGMNAGHLAAQMMNRVNDKLEGWADELECDNLLEAVGIDVLDNIPMGNEVCSLPAT